MPSERMTAPPHAGALKSRLLRRPLRRPPITRGWPGLVALLAAVLGFAAPAGCSQPGAPLPERQSVSPNAEPVKPVRFGNRIVLTILKPESYLLISELGETFEVHHIWRSAPVSLKDDANLGIFAGPFALPHCKGGKSPGKAVTPQRAREAGLRWRFCATSAPGLQAWETFRPAGRGLVVHLFILGKNEAEMKALQRIARTLKILP